MVVLVEKLVKGGKSGVGDEKNLQLPFVWHGNAAGVTSTLSAGQPSLG